jgi:hypothetical protein
VQDVGQLGLAVGAPAEEGALRVEVVKVHPGVRVSQGRDDDDPEITFVMCFFVAKVLKSFQPKHIFCLDFSIRRRLKACSDIFTSI